MALKSTIDLTVNDHISVFEFDIFSRLGERMKARMMGERERREGVGRERGKGREEGEGERGESGRERERERLAT